MNDLLPALPRYQAYKDSGVEWIGEIPEHWDLSPLKHRLILVSEKVSSKNMTHLYYGMENVESWTGKFIEGFTTVEGLANKFKKNDILFGKLRPYLAKVALADMDGLCSTEFLVYRVTNSQVAKYFKYLLSSSIFINLVDSSTYGSKMPRANANFIGIQKLPFPSLSEQTTIAAFLDCKTAKIDQALAIKEKQIQLLKERKQILIQTAVTKGLDPNVPLRDSGVEWIGEIPAHWIIKRAKYLFSEVNERSNTGKEELLSVSHMTGVTPRSEKNVNMFMAEDYSGSKTCQENDLVFNIMWAWMGALGVADQPGIVSSSYGVFRQRVKDSFNPNYLEYLLKTKGYIEHYNKISTGLHSSRLRFYGHMFFNMEIGFPNREEQDKIVAHIQTQSAKIDKAVAGQEQMIERLREYKATLINAAVTGKIRVPVQTPEKTVA